jgi:hypothetical protein
MPIRELLPKRENAEQVARAKPAISSASHFSADGLRGGGMTDERLLVVEDGHETAELERMT